MLHDHIWRQLAEPDEHTLCAAYMDQRTIKRLGRSTAIVLVLLTRTPASAQDASRFRGDRSFTTPPAASQAARAPTLMG